MPTPVRLRNPRASSVIRESGSLSSADACVRMVSIRGEKRDESGGCAVSGRTRNHKLFSLGHNSAIEEALIFTVWPGSSGGQPCDVQPEHLESVHGAYELIHIDGLANVTVRMKLVRPEHVGVAARGGENHHRDALQDRVALQLAHNFASVLARKLEVENAQVGAGH